jgi:hypothetical protein
MALNKIRDKIMKNLYNESYDQSKINNEELFEIEPNLLESISGGRCKISHSYKDGKAVVTVDHD